MKNLTFLFFTFLILIIGFAACSDDDNDKKVPIERVEAISEIKLEKYPQLSCFVNGEEYDYAVEGDKIIITPKKDGQIAYAHPYKENNSPTGCFAPNGVYISFKSPDQIWGSEIDQSSFDKMLSFDEFSTYKGGDLSSVITGLTITRGANMVSFNIKGIPSNAIVSIKDENPTQTTIITPYLTKIGSYQCIYYDLSQFVVSVKIEDIEYQTLDIYYAITSLNRTSPTAPYTYNFYNFEVVYNPDAEKDEDKLVIQNGTIEPWINQHFEDK